MWDAHIFEIDLFTFELELHPSEVTSDCESNPSVPASNAFDGDGSNKWVTCHTGESRVGKGVSLRFSEMVAITKVCFKQWPTAGNAIPEWDVKYSTDGGSSWTSAFVAALPHSGAGGPTCVEREAHAEIDPPECLVGTYSGRPDTQSRRA